MIQKLFIFGAGASYGSDISDTPALGNQLFQELQNKFPDSWGKLDKNISLIFNEDFEKGMVYISKNHSQLLAPLQRAMAIYFFDIRLYSTNLYLKLIDRINKANWITALITFNYERLLETAINHNNLIPCCGGPPKSSNEIEVCYPHGCCHFFNESIQASGNIVISGLGIETSGNIRAIMKPDEFYKRISNDPFPPVMSYFEPNKKTLSGANFIAAQKEKYKYLVLNSESIAIIGLKVREYDKHIWVPLAETSAKIVYCSGKNSGNEYEIWQNKNRKKQNDKILFGYFSDKFEELCNSIEI